jgi:hypothetical protein
VRGNAFTFTLHLLQRTQSAHLHTSLPVVCCGGVACNLAALVVLLTAARLLTGSVDVVMNEQAHDGPTALVKGCLRVDEATIGAACMPFNEQFGCTVQPTAAPVLQTGAMMVALGQGIAGAFTPSDALADKLKTASSHAGAP